MISFFRKYRALKIAGIILLLSVLAVFGTGKYLSRHYRNLLLDKLPGIAAKATDGLYRLSAGDIEVNVLARSISIFNLQLSPDPAMVAKRRKNRTLPPILMDISIREIELSGLKTDKGKAITEVRCRVAGIYHPKITVTATDPASRGHVPHEKALPTLKKVLANELDIYDPEVIVRTGSGDSTGIFSAKGGTVQLKQWGYEPGKKAGPGSFLFAQEGQVRLCNVSWRSPGMRNLYDLDTVALASAAHTAVIRGFRARSVLDREDFFKENGTQKEIYEGSFPLIELSGFNWEALLAYKGFAAATATFGNPELNIYHNQFSPPNTASKMGNYPHELLRKLDFPLAIPVVYLNGGAFHYSELAKSTKRTATLDFTGIYGSISGITTSAKAFQSAAHCVIKFTSKFMRKSDLGVVFDFPLAARDGTFKVTGQLQELDGSQLSDAAMALALAKIKSLKLHRVDFAIEGDDSASAGDITILYNDLKIGIMKMDTARQRMRKRGLVSMVANGLVLYNDNPMDGEPVRVAHTAVVRDPAKSFINQLWKNLFQAGVQTAVRQEGLTDLVNKSKANKGKAKLHFFRKLFPKRARKRARNKFR